MLKLASYLLCIAVASHLALVALPSEAYRSTKYATGQHHASSSQCSSVAIKRPSAFVSASNTVTLSSAIISRNVADTTASVCSV
eukprot:8196-Heterococcus_DN1.PRE.3